MTDIYGRPLYGDPNNLAWNQYFYLQGKAREAREARKKQVEDAERQIREMIEQRKAKRLARESGAK